MRNSFIPRQGRTASESSPCEIMKTSETSWLQLAPSPCTVCAIGVILEASFWRGHFRVVILEGVTLEVLYRSYFGEVSLKGIILKGLFKGVTLEVSF